VPTTAHSAEASVCIVYNEQVMQLLNGCLCLLLLTAKAVVHSNSRLLNYIINTEMLKLTKQVVSNKLNFV